MSVFSLLVLPVAAARDACALTFRMETRLNMMLRGSREEKRDEDEKRSRSDDSQMGGLYKKMKTLKDSNG